MVLLFSLLVDFAFEVNEDDIYMIISFVFIDRGWVDFYYLF